MKYIQVPQADGSIKLYPANGSTIVEIGEPSKPEETGVAGWIWALVIIIVVGSIIYGGATFR